MLLGADFARWQGDVDFVALGSHEYDVLGQRLAPSFGWIKAVDGVSGPEQKFVRNWRTVALDERWLASTYIYAQPMISAAAQIRKLVQITGKLDERDMRPAIDLEKTGGLGAHALLDWLREAVDTHEELTDGFTPVVYVGGPFWIENLGDLDCPELARCPLWLPAYPGATYHPPKWIPKPWRDRGGWAVHQFDGDGGLRMPNGVDADFNLFRGTRAEFESIMLPRREVPPTQPASGAANIIGWADRAEDEARAIKSAIGDGEDD